MDCVDYQILKLSKKYNLYYTRYADDLSFSTNNQYFIINKDDFISELTKLLEKNGFSINNSKTRVMSYDKRQEVTGLTVNKVINVSKYYYKKVRAMVDHFIIHGYFYTSDEKIYDIDRLLSRLLYLCYIEDLKKNERNTAFWKDYELNGEVLIQNNYEEKIKKKYNYKILSERERTLQKLIIYKYFYYMNHPLIFVEGKTDIRYINAYLKSKKESKKEYRNYIYGNQIPQKFKYYMSEDYLDFDGGVKIGNFIYNLYYDYYHIAKSYDRILLNKHTNMTKSKKIKNKELKKFMIIYIVRI